MTKVLVIDDHEDVRQLLTDGIQFAGYKVVTAVDGEDGWQKIVDESPDIILMDIMMPKMDGFSLLQKLRQQPPAKKWIPVILVSALNELKDMKKGFTLEADHYITKPWEMGDVIKGIETMVRLIPQRKVENVKGGGKKQLQFHWEKQTLSPECREIACPPYDDYKDFHMEPTGCYVLIRVNDEKQRMEVALCDNTHSIIRIFYGKSPNQIYHHIFRTEQEEKAAWFKNKDHVAYLGKELKKAELALLKRDGSYLQE